MSKHYSENIKREACRRVYYGKSPKQVAKELDVNRTTVYRWLNTTGYLEELKVKGSKEKGSFDEQFKKYEKEIVDLKERNRSLREENRILRKAYQIIQNLPE